MLGTDASIGTEATQSTIIENLVAANFIERKNRDLIPTKIGRIVEMVMPDELRGPGLTAVYERCLEKIAVGALDAKKFAADQVTLVKKLVAQARVTPFPAATDWNGSGPRGVGRTTDTGERTYGKAS